MRVFQLHTGTNAPAMGKPFRPRGNTVGFQVAIEGPGDVSATIQPKGGIGDMANLIDIGDPVEIAGTGSATEAITIEASVSDFIFLDVTACSVMSLNAWGSDADPKG